MLCSSTASRDLNRQLRPLEGLTCALEIVWQIVREIKILNISPIYKRVLLKFGAAISCFLYLSELIRLLLTVPDDRCALSGID